MDTLHLKQYMNKKNLVCLVMIVGAAGLLRLWNLGVGDLATDEAKTALGIAYPHSFVLPDLSVWSQSIFGASEWAVRLPFALMGVLTVWLWYVIGTKLKNQNFGLIVAGLATIIPTNVIFSRTAYLDAPVIGVWLAALYFWLVTEQESENMWANFGLWFFLMLAPFFKLQAVYLHVVLGLIIVWQTRGKFWQDARTWIIAISIVPIMVYVLGQPQQMYDIYAYVFNQSTGVKADSSLVLFIRTIGYWLWPCLALGIIGLWTERKTIFNSKNSYLPFLGVGVMTLVFSILGTRQLYYVAMTDTLFVLGAGLGIWYVAEKWKNLAIILSVVLIVWSGFIIFSSSGIIKNICTRVQNGCYWQSTSTTAWIEKIQTEKNTTYYLDENLGYMPKWRLPFETKKLDSFVGFLNEPTRPIVLITAPTNMWAKDLTDDVFEVSDTAAKVVILKPDDSNVE